ncbi:hypothetical protein HPB48_005215 [Haemaphysalis longicornis]|uniref:Uncharacterized protein n=1 Tax=Haemaphysalis longicornis TaxID=44386 RepID=A0A9J6FGT1_HAELO|nr:hypothetical protein HPB48_005215 [Haemaphysalis longicornis]
MPRRISLEERREIIALAMFCFSQKLPGRLTAHKRQLTESDRRSTRTIVWRRRRIKGGPRKTTQVEDALIIAAAVEDPFTTATKIKEEFGLCISVSAIRRPS